MRCIVCFSVMQDYFSKDFNGSFGLSKVYYVKCIKCGFVASKTHYDMSKEQWEKLNHDFHYRFFSDSSFDDLGWKQRLIEHSIFLRYISSEVKGDWLDWGCGDGRLADLLSRDGINVSKYDKYTGFNCDLTRKYDLVVNTAVFEHVRCRETIEEINSLVNNNGSMAIHTKIPHIIPKDPKWKYLLPVHCSFFTINSMNLLFDEWKYKTCIFYERPVMWVLSKRDGFVFKHSGAVISNRFIG